VKKASVVLLFTFRVVPPHSVRRRASAEVKRESGELSSESKNHFMNSGLELV